MKLAEVLCFHETRTVGQDWCVRYDNRWFQIDKKHAPAPTAKGQDA